MWYKEQNLHMLLVKNVLALCYPFLEVWGTAVFQANAPRSHIPERFRLGFLQLSAQWHAWLVLSQLVWVQKRETKGSAHDTNLKERKKWRFVRLAGIRRCNKSSHRSQRGHMLVCFNSRKQRTDNLIHWINRIWRICSTDYFQWWILLVFH